MNAKKVLAVIAVIVLAGGATALADGMIVPVRPDLPVRGQWSVKYHHVKITVRDQVASVHIDQAFVNNGRGDLEVEYLFPIPPGAAVKGMTMVVDGKELTGRLMKAEEARKIYEDIVRRKKDPALLEYVGYGLYRTRAFPLQPGKPANVIVTYETVCKKDRDLVEVFYPLNTEKFSAKKIEDVSVRVDIKARADITAVYSPTHDLKKDKDDPRHVVATYHVKNEAPDIDFQVYYRAANEKIGATVLTHRGDPKADGYFLALVSPNPKLADQAAGSKDIVVVLDHSGSMAQDRKLDQAKEALRYVLSSLNVEDRFNVVAFCDSVDSFFPKLADATKDNVSEALDMLDRIEATGGTNIHEAVTAGMGMFGGGGRPGYLLFLTDGIPTVGERNEGKIIKAAKEANSAKARMFAFGVGYDVNVRLIDNLVKANRGLSDYVRPKEPLESKISRLYDKIKKPLMTDVAVSFKGVRSKMTYPQELPDLFSGGQIVLVGRYDKGGRSKMKVTGKLLGADQSFSYKVVLDKHSETNKNKFVERLWAVRRIGFLLDEIQLNGESKEVIDELIRLSTTYGIMTPYTSFLAEEGTNLTDKLELRKVGERAGLAAGLGTVVGEAGQRNADVRSQLRKAARPLGPASVMARTPADDGTAVYRELGQIIGNTTQWAYEAGMKETVSNLRQVGNIAMYRRGNQFYTPDLAGVDVKTDAGRIRTIRQFNEEYFTLARANTRQQNELLASQRAGEELMVSLRGQIYRILPAAR